MSIIPAMANAIEVWPVERLVPYSNNARTHSDAQVAKVAASVKEFGFTSPILVDGQDGIIAGHCRLMAARKLGLEQVPVIILDHLSDAQRRAYILADNKLALEAGWDNDILAAELDRLQEDGYDLEVIGFSDEELGGLLDGMEEQDEGGDGGGEESIPEPPKTPITCPGDLWLLGEHRLICGDATDLAIVHAVMAGEQADLCFTSPPYGQQRDYTQKIGDWDALMQGVFSVLPVGQLGQILVNLGLTYAQNDWNPYWLDWSEWMRSKGWRRFGWYVWDQGSGLPGHWNGRLAPSFEFVFHFNKEARTPNKIVPKQADSIVDRENNTGLRNPDGSICQWSSPEASLQTHKIPDSVLRITRHSNRGELEKDHPAMFPIALPEFVLSAYSNPGEVVFEPFCGSGTSIIAAQRIGRKSRAVEIAPEYVDVAVLRFQKYFPDVPVVLSGSGKSFAEVAAGRGVVLG
ncbi:MAG: site-specific DNA-methyltransferase [Magnetococcus sp. XQGC-1]